MSGNPLDGLGVVPKVMIAAAFFIYDAASSVKNKAKSIFTKKKKKKP